MADIHHIHRAKPRLVRKAPDLIQRQADAIDAYLNRPARKPEPIETTLSDFAAGAAAGFLVGISPFVVMLAYLVFAS